MWQALETFTYKTFCSKPNCIRTEKSQLSKKEKTSLYNAIGDVLNHRIKLGGLTYEKDFYGQTGKFTINEFLVGYKTGKPCPTCKTSIEKIKTGTTSSYICPKRQTLK